MISSLETFLDLILSTSTILLCEMPTTCYLRKKTSQIGEEICLLRLSSARSRTKLLLPLDGSTDGEKRRRSWANREPRFWRPGLARSCRWEPWHARCKSSRRASSKSSPCPHFWITPAHHIRVTSASLFKHSLFNNINYDHPQDHFSGYESLSIWALIEYIFNSSVDSFRFACLT